jgi:hypothetical protein
MTAAWNHDHQQDDKGKEAIQDHLNRRNTEQPVMHVPTASAAT